MTEVLNTPIVNTTFQRDEVMRRLTPGFIYADESMTTLFIVISVEPEAVNKMHDRDIVITRVSIVTFNINKNKILCYTNISARSFFHRGDIVIYDPTGEIL